jgi:hypothetical protein
MRWLIDGMNVIGTRPDGWWTDRHEAMVRLVGQLELWAASGGEDVTVVFEQPPKPPIRSSVLDVGGRVCRAGPLVSRADRIGMMRSGNRGRGAFGAGS